MQMTENAAAAVEALREDQGVPQEHENRITAAPGASGDLELRLEFVEEIPEGDEVVEKAGTEIYLDPVVVSPLEGTLMDVEQTGEGLAFVFRGQEA